jgi:hypothetical protein
MVQELQVIMAISPVYANSSNQIAALKELYTDDKDYMKNIVYAKNPWLAMIPKNESPDGFAGKYIPVPLEYGNPQGRAHVFANAQNQQTASDVVSYFVYAVQDYQLVTITNLLMEQTKSNAGAFVDEASRTLDNGFRNISNNMAFELFSGGTASRGTISAAGTAISGTTLTFTLANSQSVVQFEVGMTLQGSATDGGAALTGSGSTVLAAQVTSVNRGTGVITAVVVQDTYSSTWPAGTLLQVFGDIGTAGATTIAGLLGLSGLAAWVPSTDPISTDNFWGVNRSADPTRLGGLRYNASSQSISEGITNALALANREGAAPDLIILDFVSYATLINELGAKVQYVQLEHDEVEVAFEAIHFHSAYGKIPVMADRSCPPQTAYCLTVDTWKLRTLGKAPHILTYGMEGLEGLRVGNADALEIRIAYYGNLICSAPGYNMVVSLSA